MIDKFHVMITAIVAIAFIVFIGIVATLTLKSGETETKRMEVCVENGGTYDASRNSCYTANYTEVD